MGVFKDFIESDMQMVYTDAKRVHCARCFELHLERSALGGVSMKSRLDGIRKNARRKKGGEKMP